MYTCKHFAAHELVPISIYQKRGEKSYQCIDDRLLKLIDMLRELFDCSITINDWKWGGNRQWSGLRTEDSPYYSNTSQHTFGRAVDMLVSKYDAFTARKMIKEWMDQGRFEAIGVFSVTLEEGAEITWVHIDVRNNEEGYNEFWV